MRSFGSSILKTVFKKFSSLLAAKIVLKIFGFLSFALVARYLGQTDFGIFAFGLAFVWIFLLLADAGMSELTLRDAALHPAGMNKFLSGIFSTKLALGVFAYLMILGFAYCAVKDPLKLQMICLLGLGIVLDSFMDFFRGILHLMKPYPYELASFFLDGFIKVSFILVVIMIHGGGQKILWISGGLFIASLMTCGIHYLFIQWKFHRPLKLNFDWIFSVGLLRSGFLFIAIYILSLLNFRIDILMVSQFLGDSASGLYGITSKTIEQVLLIPLTFGYVSLPIMVNVLTQDAGRFLKSLRPLLLGCFAGGVLTSVVLFSFAGILIRVLFGESYLMAQGILKTLCWVVIPFYLKPVLEKGLSSAHRQVSVFVIYLASCFLKIVLNQWWIPLWGIQGAVVSALICEVVVAGLLAIRLFSLKIKI